MPGATIDEARLVTDPERGELNMVFQFEHVGLDQGIDKYHVIRPPRGALAQNLTMWQKGLADHGWNSLYLCNHDQPRPVSRFGDATAHWYESATALATALHLLRGTPYVYQGEELGMTNFPWRSIEQFRDVEAVNYWNEQLSEHAAAEEDPESSAREGVLDTRDDPAHLEAELLSGLAAMSRDNARTPVQWDDGANAGFTAGTPWIAVNPNKDAINAASQVGTEGSVFEYYRALIDLRHRSDVVALGDFERIDAGDRAIFAYRRELYGESIVVVVNLSSDEVAPHWNGADPCETAGVPVLSNTARGARGGRVSPESTLLPWEARVYATADAIDGWEQRG